MSLEKSDLHRFLSGSSRNRIRRLLHPAHLGKSGITERGDPLCRFITKLLRSDTLQYFFLL